MDWHSSHAAQRVFIIENREFSSQFRFKKFIRIMHGGDLPLLLFKTLDETLTCEINRYQSTTEVISLFICEYRQSIHFLFSSLLEDRWKNAIISNWNLWKYNLGTYVSVPFIIATILVYVCLSELRNTHGKCLIFYLSCRVLSSIIANLYLIRNLDLIFIGFYLLLISTQLLQVISFDIWWSLRNLR